MNKRWYDNVRSCLFSMNVRSAICQAGRKGKQRRMSDTTHPSVLANIQRTLARRVDQVDAETAELWHDFFEAYNALLYRFAGHLDCPRELMDDVVAAVWSDVCQRLPHFEYDPQRGGFRRWLYRIVRSKTIDEIRRRRIRVRVTPNNRDTGFWHSVTGKHSNRPIEAIEEAFEHEVAIATWQRFQQKAPEKERRAVELCLIDGLSSVDAATRLNSTPAAVRKAIQRARLRLRLLAAEMFGRDDIAAG